MRELRSFRIFGSWAGLRLGSFRIFGSWAGLGFGLFRIFWLLALWNWVCFAHLVRGLGGGVVNWVRFVFFGCWPLAIGCWVLAIGCWGTACRARTGALSTVRGGGWCGNR